MAVEKKFAEIKAAHYKAKDTKLKDAAAEVQVRNDQVKAATLELVEAIDPLISPIQSLSVFKRATLH